MKRIAALQVRADRQMDVVMEETSVYKHAIKKDDLASHTEAWTTYFNTLTQCAAPDPLYQGLKAQVNGKLVGCVFTATETKLDKKSTGSIQGLFVHPEYWGLGIAKALVSQAMVGLKEQDVSLCTLWAQSNNEFLDNFYRHLGWERRPQHTEPMRINGRNSFATLFERRL